jgi:hypothetical protein
MALVSTTQRRERSALRSVFNVNVFIKVFTVATANDSLNWIEGEAAEI